LLAIEATLLEQRTTFTVKIPFATKKGKYKGRLTVEMVVS